MQALPDKGFVWQELMTSDPDQAKRFYAEVVGIAASRMGEGTSAYRLAMVDWPAIARPRSWRMMAPCWIGRCERGLGVLRLQLNAEDLARVRVSSSWGPFNEALLSLTRLRNPGRDLLVDGWRRAVPGQLWPRMAPLLVLAPKRGLVDLHTVVGNAGSIGEALDRLEGAPDDHLRKELAFLRPSLEGAGTWLVAGWVASARVTGARAGCWWSWSGSTTHLPSIRSGAPSRLGWRENGPGVAA